MLNGFSEKLRASITPDGEERLSLLAALMDCAACRALEDIRKVLDDRLDDPSCFWRIEKIVKIYEKIGFDGGSRRDF